MSGHGLAVREGEQSSTVRGRRKRLRYLPVIGEKGTLSVAEGELLRPKSIGR
jgi:hypothetical protein